MHVVKGGGFYPPLLHPCLLVSVQGKDWETRGYDVHEILQLRVRLGSSRWVFPILISRMDSFRLSDTKGGREEGRKEGAGCAGWETITFSFTSQSQSQSRS